jgi:hypothetical protein
VLDGVVMIADDPDEHDGGEEQHRLLLNPGGAFMGRPTP